MNAISNSENCSFSKFGDYTRADVSKAIRLLALHDLCRKKQCKIKYFSGLDITRNVVQIPGVKLFLHLLLNLVLHFFL